jgi:hypothetical protein
MSLIMKMDYRFKSQWTVDSNILEQWVPQSERLETPDLIYT